MDNLEALIGQLTEAVKAGAAATNPEAISAAVEKALAAERAKSAPTVPTDAPTLSDITTKSEGYCVNVKSLMEEPSADARVREAQRLNDRVYMLKALMPGVDVRKLRSFGELQARIKGLGIAVDGAGADFVPDSFSSTLVEEMQLDRKIPGLVAQRTIPRSPYKSPVSGVAGLPYLISEQTGDPATRIPVSTPTTDDQTYTAKVLGLRVPISFEFDEDSIVSSEEYVRAQIAQTIANGLETAILNGDASGATHRDTVVTAANDCRRTWDGLRYLAHVATACEYDCATVSAPATAAFEEGDFVRTMGKLSENARLEDLVAVVSKRGALTIAANAASLWPSFITMEKAGSQAINVNGLLGYAFGVPIVVSSYMSNTLHTDGTDTGLGSTSGLMIFARNAFVLATLRGVTIETVRDVESQQFRVVGTYRADFKPLVQQAAAAHRMCAFGYKVALTV